MRKLVTLFKNGFKSGDLKYQSDERPSADSDLVDIKKFNADYKNKDTSLDLGGANPVTAEDIKKLIDNPLYSNKWASPDVGVKYDGSTQYSSAADNSALESIKEIEFVVNGIDITTTQEIATLGTNLTITSVSGTVTLGSAFANTSIYVNNNLNGTLEDGFNLIQIQFDEIDFSSAKFATDGTNYGDITILKIKPYNLQSSTTVLTARWNNGDTMGFVEPFEMREASNTELLSGWDFTSGWSQNRATVSNITATSFDTDDDASLKSYAGTLEIGIVYKIETAGTKVGDLNIYSSANELGDQIITDSDGNNATDFGTYTFIATGTRLSFRHRAVGTVTFTTLKLTKLGNVADWDFTNGGVAGVLDGSLNGNHLQHVASPIVLNNEIRRDIKLAITGDTTITDVIPASHKRKYLVIEETAGNAVTLNVGTSASGTDVVSGASIIASDITYIEIDNVDSLTDATSLYFSSSAWNSASINVTIVMEKI